MAIMYTPMPAANPFASEKTILHSPISHSHRSYRKLKPMRFMGKVLLIIVASLLFTLGIYAQTLTFSTPGTYSFTIPNGVTSITVRAWGGGGGGGTQSGNTNSKGGGGGGGYVTNTYSVVGGTVYTDAIVVGSGGGIGANGNPSSYNITGTVTASGGQRPADPNQNNSGQGGAISGSFGAGSSAGGAGGARRNNQGGGGGGGSGPGGGAGGAINNPGQNGQSAGGGGGGRGNNGGTSGSGADGQVIIIMNGGLTTLAIADVPTDVNRGTTFNVTYTVTTSITDNVTWTLTPTCDLCTGFTLNPSGTQTTSSGNTSRSWTVTFTAQTTGGPDPQTISIGGSASSSIGTVAASIVNSTLPIELLSFSGKRVNGTVQLHWVTASEKQNEYMEVQRSPNGKTFEPLGKVQGQGDSYQPVDYTFVDDQPLPGVNYYRLKQVDFDGKFEYHKVIAVLFKDQDDKVQGITLFPTVVSEQLNFALSQETTTDGEYYISDLNGRVLLRQAFERGMQQQSIPVHRLPKGQYILTVQTGREMQVARFVKE